MKRQRALLEYALGGLRRRAGKHLAMTIGLAFVVGLYASALFLAESLREVWRTSLVEAPDLVVQRMEGGRPALIEESVARGLIAEGTPGVRAVEPRVWGYLFVEAIAANVTIVAGAAEANAVGEGDVGLGTETETETETETRLCDERADQRFAAAEVRAARVLARTLEAQQERGLAEHAREAFAPFDADHVLACADERFEVELVELARIGQSVEIRMHERGRRFGVFVQQREGRALDGHVVGDSERPREGAREERLARAEVAFEDHEVACAQRGAERVRERLGRGFVRELDRRFRHVRSFARRSPARTASEAGRRRDTATIGCDPARALIQPRGSAEDGPRRAARRVAPRRKTIARAGTRKPTV